MLSEPTTAMEARWKAATPSIVGIEYPDSIIGALAAAVHGNFDADVTPSAAVAA